MFGAEGRPGDVGLDEVEVRDGLGAMGGAADGVAEVEADDLGLGVLGGEGVGHLGRAAAGIEHPLTGCNGSVIFLDDPFGFPFGLDAVDVALLEFSALPVPPHGGEALLGLDLLVGGEEAGDAVDDGVFAVAGKEDAADDLAILAVLAREREGLTGVGADEMREEGFFHGQFPSRNLISALWH